jgi:hypothetical protein
MIKQKIIRNLEYALLNNNQNMRFSASNSANNLELCSLLHHLPWKRKKLKIIVSCAYKLQLTTFEQTALPIQRQNINAKTITKRLKTKDTVARITLLYAGFKTASWPESTLCLLTVRWRDNTTKHVFKLRLILQKDFREQPIPLSEELL